MTDDALTALLPAPGHIERRAGRLVLTEPVTIDVAADSAAMASGLVRSLALLPMRLSTGRPGQGAQVTVRLVPGMAAPEAYHLSIAQDGVRITAPDPAGVAFAVQTLRQLLPDDGYRARPPAGLDLSLPCCVIHDAPRFAWRGALIDVARHFLPKHALLRQIDLLAAHKINRLQLHLTDEQGWRIESTRFPRLTSIGAWRRQSMVSHHRDAAVFDGTPHGGFYSKTDLREIHDFAADRGMLLVPEIELPGHCGALLAAYPELGAPERRDRAVLCGWGLHDTLVAPTEGNFAVIEAILEEICDVLPGRFIHVGGDESRLDGWDADPRVRHYAAERGLATRPAIFADFMARVQAILAALGREMITWDDSFATQQHAVSAGDGAIITAWRGHEVARRAAACGRQVILAPVFPTYFDYAQSDAVTEPLAIGGPVTLADVARWEPLPANWSAAEQAQVLGVQCQVWTEYIADPRRLDYMLYPRLCAFADVAWGGPVSTRGARLARQLGRLTAAGVEFRPPDGPHPWQQGGTGRMAHRAGAPLAAILALHAQAADHGATPDDASYRALGSPS
jgi:hexosaminidase